jgi:hypothetical protein
MIYTIRHSNWQWLIETDEKKKRSILRFKRPTDWTECNTYDTPEDAADAVATGRTGQRDWDEMKRESPIPSLASWLIDPAGQLAAAVPFVADAIRAALPKPNTDGAA